jgi:hypothetical protein
MLGYPALLVKPISADGAKKLNGFAQYELSVR